MQSNATGIISTDPSENPRRDAVWERLEGRTFNKLRAIWFEGTPYDFTRWIVGAIRRAPNISNLDFNILQYLPSDGYLWHPDDPLPNLSTLRLRNFPIRWSSPLLRNLSKLTMRLVLFGFGPEPTSIETFLAVLTNCPNLEILSLAEAGPLNPDGYQDDCGMVVQLHKLRKLSISFGDPSRVGFVLSHIGYPESTKLEVYVPVWNYIDMSGTIPEILTHRNVETIQHFRRSRALSVHLNIDSQFFTDNLLVYFRLQDMSMDVLDPQVLPRFASKIVDVIGMDTIISLDVETWYADLPNGMWEAFLHGLPRLERICYGHHAEGVGNLADPFVLVFSQPFEGGLVCPLLQHLELPRVVLIQGSSAAILKSALAKRGACGRRLKRIGFSGDATKAAGGGLVLEPFRDLVDEVL